MKKSIFIIFAMILSSILYCFEWPQGQQVDSSSFYSYFGQLRGDTISNSLVFSEKSKVNAADDGTITIIIQNYNDESDFFPSTLGNAVIIAHQDNLLTVYGNLEEESMNFEIFDCADSSIQKGTYLAETGNSAWQQGNSSLEFQVIDTKNNTSINPRILMPRVGKEIPLYISGIMMQNRNGAFINISEQRSIPAGSYKVYSKRQNVALPYKTYVSVNGAILDEISYNILRQDNNRICVSGSKKNYPKSLVYPTKDLMLLGEVSFTQGKNAIQFALVDILGKETTATYYLTNY